MRVRSAHHHSLRALQQQVQALTATVATLSATIAAQQVSPPRTANTHKQATIRLQTSAWHAHAHAFATSCPKYQLPDGSPNKQKIAQDARAFTTLITAENIELIFKALREKAEAEIPF